MSVLPSPAGPPVAVRAMTGADIDAVAAVRVGGWRRAYAGLMPQERLDALDAAADAARHRARFADASSRSTDLVARDADGDVVGWACFGPVRDAGLARGEAELYALYVRPDLIGTGVGRALMAEVLRRCADRPALRLWVVEGNVLGRRFYERAGFVPDGAVSCEEMAGAVVREVRYRRAGGRGAGA
ncbi:GNAT family N-acetyltransferase [Streptomyces subrutilus]|uniref:GNAT family N-acetyltransferase n=1 Tax=Streptomyces subrutilus TaxID=36818 RepID=UPI0033FFB349